MIHTQHASRVFRHRSRSVVWNARRNKRGAILSGVLNLEFSSQQFADLAWPLICVVPHRRHAYPQ
jgi:hypothetical protein